jgi:predicted Zn-dependent protease
MTRYFTPAGKHLTLALALIALFAGCRTAPITGRKQVLLLPEQQEIAMGFQAFKEVADKEPLSQNTEQVELVNRVGRRIADVADRPDYEWEFLLIASPEKNAFCLPGGKVAVYEGILPICENEAGLAVVMSHEIAHALARHGGERMSHNMAVEGIRYAVDYFTKEREERQREMIMKAYGLGARYGVILPYSRKHESEADHMGLMLMARAGYDPGEAPRFWQRFAQAQSAQGPPEFLSTHPSDERRTEDLLALLPEAQRVYQESPVPLGTGADLRVVSSPGATFAPAASPVSPLTLVPRNPHEYDRSFFFSQSHGDTATESEFRANRPTDNALLAPHLRVSVTP